MARRGAYRPLSVFLNGRAVGALRRSSDGAISFQYAQDWLRWEQTFPISLSLPLRETRYTGAKVFNVFDNLLPDNDAIRRRIAERLGADGIDAYSMLDAIGHDCVGALQFLPDGETPGATGAIEGAPLADGDIAALLDNLASAPLGIGEDDFRISLAGVQEKTALLRFKGEWLRPLGTTATTHIIKPPIGRLPNGADFLDSVQNEYLCLKLLAAFGLPVATAEVAEFAGRKALVVERFDRRFTRDGRLLRRPQEDVCQALSLPSTRKYQSDGGPGMKDVIDLLRASDQPDLDVATFFRACIGFWLLGATDGHAKNFSIFIGPGGGFQLTPLYDVMSLEPTVAEGRLPWQAYRLAMSAGRSKHHRMSEIAPRHFEQTAASCGIGLSVARALLAEMAESGARAEAALGALPGGLAPSLVDPILAGIHGRARLLATA